MIDHGFYGIEMDVMTDSPYLKQQPDIWECTSCPSSLLKTCSAMA